MKRLVFCSKQRQRLGSRAKESIAVYYRTISQVGLLPNFPLTSTDQEAKSEVDPGLRYGDVLSISLRTDMANLKCSGHLR